MELRGKCSVVTGSTKGIGLSIARSLLQEGVNVVISSRHQKDVEERVCELEQQGRGHVIGRKCDVRDPEEVRQLIDYCVNELGRIDVLVNNAGVGIFKSVEKMSVLEWKNVIRTNLDGVFFGCHFAIPEMRKNGGGFIVNIGSLAGKNAFPKGAAYNASKFGLTGFSEALMQEIRYDDIRVAYVMPGSVDTSFRGRSQQGVNSWKLSAEDVAEVVVQTIQRHPRSLTSRIEIRPSKPVQK